MPDPQYLSTDPNAGQPSKPSSGYLSTDPNAGQTSAKQPEKTGYSPIKTIKDNFGKFYDSTFGNPIEMGAILGGIAASVPTGGLSLIPHALAIGGGSALGAGAGQAVSGQMPSLGTMAKAGAAGTLTDATLGVAPIALRALKSPGASTIKVLDMAGNVGVPGAKPVARILKFAKAIAGDAEPAAQAAASAANTGGRLVKPAAKETIESAIGDALQETQAFTPKSVSLPPEPSLPPGYTPRSSAGRAATAKAPKPTPKLAPEVPKPQLVAKEPQLPESWKPFVKQESGTVGLPNAGDTPMWSRGVPKQDAVSGMRGALGAEDAGALLGMEADDVRAISGAAKRRPLSATNAELDRNYMRLLDDPKAALAITGTGAAGIAELMRLALVEKLANTSGSSER